MNEELRNARASSFCLLPSAFALAVPDCRRNKRRGCRGGTMILTGVKQRLVSQWPFLPCRERKKSCRTCQRTSSVRLCEANSRRKRRCGSESNGEWQRRFGRAIQFYRVTKLGWRNGAAILAEYSGGAVLSCGFPGASQSSGNLNKKSAVWKSGLWAGRFWARRNEHTSGTDAGLPWNGEYQVWSQNHY